MIRTALVFAAGALVGIVGPPALDHGTQRAVTHAPFVVVDHLVDLVTPGPPGPGGPRP